MYKHQQMSYISTIDTIQLQSFQLNKLSHYAYKQISILTANKTNSQPFTVKL